MPRRGFRSREASANPGLVGCRTESGRKRRCRHLLDEWPIRSQRDQQPRWIRHAPAAVITCKLGCSGTVWQHGAPVSALVLSRFGKAAKVGSVRACDALGFGVGRHHQQHPLPVHSGFWRSKHNQQTLPFRGHRTAHGHRISLFVSLFKKRRLCRGYGRLLIGETLAARPCRSCWASRSLNRKRLCRRRTPSKTNVGNVPSKRQP